MGVNQRERRVIAAGIGVLIVAVLVTFVLVPLATRWQVRRARTTALSTRVAQLQALVARESSLQQDASVQEVALSHKGRRLLHAPSRAVAASVLQSLLQDAADASQVLVDRVEVPLEESADLPEADASSVSGTPSDAGQAAVTASLSVTGDIHGVAALLEVLLRGPRALRVERLSVQINPALRGASDVLQATIGVRAPVVIVP